MSAMLSTQIAEAVCSGSYRETARSVSDMTGQSISHQAAWNVAQQRGECIEKREQAAAALASKNAGTGQIESKVLFEEQDGVWLHLQGKSRKEHGKSKEMKVAIAYDGSEAVTPKRYRLTNKVATANFEPAREFVQRKEGCIAETYAVDEIEVRILNGDGASWIKQSATDEAVVFSTGRFSQEQGSSRKCQ
jgi:hypothetical protein